MRKISTTVILLLIAAVSVSFWLIPDRDGSEMENRTLAQMPTLSVGTYMNGSFKTSLEDYVADQFPLRDFFLKTYKLISSKKMSVPGAEFKQIIEGTDGFNFYIYDENQILKVYASEKDISNAEAWADKICGVAELCDEKGVDMILDFIPSKSESLNDMLPDGARDNKDETLKDYIFDNIPDTVINVDTMGEFEKMSCDEKTKLYFNTDHHWNMLGAYKGFQYFCNSLGAQTELNTDISGFNFRKYPISQTTMDGSYNRSLGDIFPRTETLEYYLPDDLSVLDDIDICNKIGRVSFSDVYGAESGGKNVSYAALNTDDYDYLYLHNDNALNDYSICVLKDSYYNALVPHMSLLFSDVYVVDTRYYKDFVMEDFIDENDIDGVMLFYSSTAFLKCDEMLGYDIRG